MSTHSGDPVRCPKCDYWISDGDEFVPHHGLKLHPYCVEVGTSNEWRPKRSIPDTAPASAWTDG